MEKVEIIFSVISWVVVDEKERRKTMDYKKVLGMVQQFLHESGFPSALQELERES